MNEDNKFGAKVNINYDNTPLVMSSSTAEKFYGKSVADIDILEQTQRNKDLNDYLIAKLEKHSAI